MGVNSGVGWITRQKLLFEKLEIKSSERMFKKYTGARVKYRMFYTLGTRKEGRRARGPDCSGLSMPSEGLWTCYYNFFFLS